MSLGSFSTGSVLTHLPFSSLRKKQLSRPVWQAMPPACSTLSRIASASQSRRNSRSFCTWPDSSPLRHSLLRERDQYTACWVFAVSSNAARFIQATVRTLPEEKSWATAAISPCSFHGTSSSQLMRAKRTKSGTDHVFSALGHRAGKTWSVPVFGLGSQAHLDAAAA